MVFKFFFYLWAFLCFSFGLSLSDSVVQAKHPHKEVYYQKIWCDEHGGDFEYILPNKKRVDCLTDTHAIEFDFGAKAYESAAQAQYYAIKTGRSPGVVLIMSKDDWRLGKHQIVLDIFEPLGSVYPGFKLWTVPE